MSRDRPLIIGVGNRYRGDDGAGLAVARALQKRAAPETRIVEASGEGAVLMEAWEGAGEVILIDAVQSGAVPGTVHRLDAAERPLPSRFIATSTHAFGVAEAIETARVLGRLPRHLILYGIEGADFTPGERLSPAVTAACDSVVERLLGEFD